MLARITDADPDHPKGTHPKTACSPSGSLVRNMLGEFLYRSLIRFKDENDYEYQIFQILFAYYHRYPGTLHCNFFTSKDNKMIKFLTFENLFPPLRHSH